MTKVVTPFSSKDSRIAAQGVQPLVRNAVTQNSPDIQVSVLFGLTERTYGDYPYRSAGLLKKSLSKVASA